MTRALDDGLKSEGTPRCHIGDVAVIVKCLSDQSVVGRLVKIVARERRIGVGDWLVRSLSTRFVFRDPKERDMHASVFDQCLQPIRAVEQVNVAQGIRESVGVHHA